MMQLFPAKLLEMVESESGIMGNNPGEDGIKIGAGRGSLLASAQCRLGCRGAWQVDGQKPHVCLGDPAIRGRQELQVFFHGTH